MHAQLQTLNPTPYTRNQALRLGVQGCRVEELGLRIEGLDATFCVTHLYRKRDRFEYHHVFARLLSVRAGKAGAGVEVYRRYKATWSLSQYLTDKCVSVQGYLAHKKPHSPLGAPRALDIVLR